MCRGNHERQLQATQRLETPHLPPPARASVLHEQREPMARVKSEMFIAQFLAMDLQGGTRG